jgi:hypothetical protein
MLFWVLIRKIWLPRPIYQALPWIAALVGAAGFVAAGPSKLMVLASWVLMSYGMVIMVVRTALGGLSHV